MTKNEANTKLDCLKILTRSSDALSVRDEINAQTKSQKVTYKDL